MTTALKYTFTCLLLLVVGQSLAQKTKVSGRVIAAETQEPIPFANVYFVDTKSGTITDMDGYYELETYYASDSLRVSAIGFNLQTKKVKLDQEQIIKILIDHLK